ncbi:MAG: hypothetical protein ACRDRT_15550, partial [Pseudonocardiaceae bacterium]
MAPGDSIEGPATVERSVTHDLARLALVMARKFNAGGTLWCASAAWPYHAHHVAVEFVHPVIMGKRALSAVALDASADLADALRISVRSGDMVLLLAGVDDAEAIDVFRRGAAWGVETIWVGAGRRRPPSGIANQVLWIDEDDGLAASEDFVRLYHLLWELTHVVFEHPGMLKEPQLCQEDVCITCSDEGRWAEVEAVEGDEAVVRTANGRERIDVSLIAGPTGNDLVLIHAGFAIAKAAEAVLL